MMQALIIGSYLPHCATYSLAPNKELQIPPYLLQFPMFYMVMNPVHLGHLMHINCCQMHRESMEG